MPTRPPHPCPACRQLTTTKGRCPTCTLTYDQARGTPHQRGYTATHRNTFRHHVLTRDPDCQCPGCPVCTHPNRTCVRDSTDADHHPHTRRQLIALGLDPNDQQYGRGLCHRCHSHHTAKQRHGKR